jgi:hypothetical protein
MEGDKTSFKEKEQAAHSTAETEKLPREQGEICKTQIAGRRIHVDNVNPENEYLKTQFQVQITYTTGALERPPTGCLCLHNALCS